MTEMQNLSPEQVAFAEDHVEAYAELLESIGETLSVLKTNKREYKNLDTGWEDLLTEAFNDLYDEIENMDKILDYVEGY